MSVPPVVASQVAQAAPVRVGRGGPVPPSPGGLRLKAPGEAGEVERRWSFAPVIRVKVDKRDPTDLYEQVAAEIRRTIADGEAKSGERLPPAKDLAAILGVNTNTVLRSLRLLRDERLLEFRRGRGISVAGTPERGAVVQQAREVVVFARGQGYHLDELVKIIQDLG